MDEMTSQPPSSDQDPTNAIRDLVKEDRLQEAVEALSRLERCRDDAILIGQGLKRVITDERQRTASQDETRAERNRISRAILNSLSTPPASVAPAIGSKEAVTKVFLSLAGLAPEAIASLLADALRRAEERVGPPAIYATRESIKRNCRHIRRMDAYKKTHDMLQHVEELYTIVCETIYRSDRQTQPGQIWVDLGRTLDALRRGIEDFCLHASGPQLDVDTSDWVQQLTRAFHQLEEVGESQDLDTLMNALDTIYDVVDDQTPHMNALLIGAVDALDLSSLVRDLRRVYAGPSGDASHTTDGRPAGFQQAVDGLEKVASRLTQLRNAHDSWQQLDDRLRGEQRQLGEGAARDVARFKLKWKDSLRPKLSGLPDDGDVAWRRKLDKRIEEVDCSLVQETPERIAAAYFNCRGVVLSRFIQIDGRLLNLCDGLVKTGDRLDELMEGACDG